MRLSYDNGLESSSGITNDTGFFVSFADMMTLLMVFFVLMYSVSKVDEDRFDEVARSVSQAFNEEVAQEIADEVSQLEKLQASLDETIKTMNLGDEISTEMTASGLKIELASNLMFGAGSADLKGGMDSTIQKLGEVIMELPTDEYTMLIEGHTDNVPINSVQFKSNWELSSMRAINVLNALEAHGFPRERLAVAAFADTRPKVPNQTEAGVPLPANQAQNRRVLINIRSDV